MSAEFYRASRLLIMDLTLAWLQLCSEFILMGQELFLDATEEQQA